MEEVLLSAYDKYTLCLHIFDVKRPKAVVQIAHGMEEHQERYVHFVRLLNSKGFTVVTADMRGHGKTAKTLGFFKNKDGDEALVSDQLKVTNYIKRRYPTLPLFLFSHSMGTMITRVLMQSHSKKYDKIVLSSPPLYSSFAKICYRLCNIVTKFNGPKFRSEQFTKTSHKFLNSKVKKPATNIDWICSNEQVIQNYINDKFCGFGFTSSGYRDLFKLDIRMNNVDEYKNIKSNLPILILWGEDDPCVGGAKEIKDSTMILVKAGFLNIKQIKYQKMRHELINEINNQIVFDDIIEFFEK